MFQRKFFWFVVLGLFTSVLAATFTGCGGHSKPLSVAVTAAASTVDGNDTTTLTATVTNDKNSAGVTWTVSGGGTLSNTTTTSATYTAPAPTSSSQSVTITATSVADTSKTGTAAITVPAMPAVTSTSASLTGAVGSAYSITLQASGGMPPYTWALGSGTTLPSCLTLKSTGVLTTTSGTAPTASCAGSYSNITFKITDSGTPTALTTTSSPMTIVITAPSITFSPTLPAGTVGAAYAGSVAATGPVGATTYSIASGALPADLSLNTSTGAITGTPKAADAGTSTFKITVVDAYGDTATSATMSLTIAAAPAITFGNAPTATGTFGASYSSAVTATGGAGALTYSLASGALPPDLSLSASGAISGTLSKATDVGKFTFAAKAADAFGDSATSSNYTIVVSYPAVTITPGAGSLPFAVTGQSYSQTLTASGGSGTGYTWTVTGLPASGLTYSANGATLTINGPATTAGTVNFTASAKDGAGNTDAGGALAYTVQVYSPVTLPLANPTSLPSTATVNLAYTGTIVAAGGSGNYSWTVAGLSDGLNYSSSAGTLTISGTPTSASTVTFTASVKDTTTGVTAGPVTYTINVYATVRLPATNPSTLGPAIVSTPYTGTIAAAGGSGNYSWTVTGLPSDNLNYSASGGTLTISGTPGGTPTTVSFTAKVTDTTTNQSSGPYTYTIGVYNAVALNASALPTSATVNVAYSGSIAASGGSGTGYTWTVTGLPADGLNYSATGGTLTISGTPTAAQALQFTAKVTDSAGNTAGPTSYTINAYNALTLPSSNPSTLGPATVNLSYTGTILASGGSGNYSWTVTGLPSDNLNYSANGGTLTISGAPGTATTVSFNATVKDTTTGVSVGPNAYTVTVYSGVTLPSPNPSTLGSADAGSIYSGTIVAAGGSGNYSWTITGLPSDGLSASMNGATLTVSGTPTSAQTVSFTAKVTDTTSNQSAGPFTYSIAVNGPLSLPTPDPASLPSTGYTGVAYGPGYINASGGSGSYSWTVSGLPSDGLAVSGGTNGSTLTISGTPTSAATVTFNVTLTDTVTNAQITKNGYNITITSPTAVTLPPANPNPLPAATVNQDYSAGINASGGVGPYTWSINGNSVGSSCYSLGNGNMCATSTGGNTLSINGTPNATGAVTLTNVKVVDSLNTSATQTYTITVSPVSTIVISINSVPQGMVNMPYTFDDLNITGGVSPYTVTYSNVPAGLGPSTSNSWSIVGTPTTAGSKTVTVKVTDSTTPTPQQQTTTFTLPVAPETVAANNSELKGQYACYIEIYWDGGVTGGTGFTLYRGGAVLAFSANGTGGITGGEVDSNSPDSGYKSASTNGSVTGTYAVGSDNRGYMIIANDGPTFAIAGGNLNSSGQFTELALTEMDDAGASPSGNHAEGHCYKQNTTGLSGISPSGGYVWGMRGEAGNGTLFGGAGYIDFSSGTFSGVADVVTKEEYQGDATMTGNSLTAADSYGRVTFNFGSSSSNINPFVMYLTNNSAGESVVMDANPHNASSNATFMVGQARAQVASALQASNPLSGPAVFYESGQDSDGQGYDADIAQISSGNLEMIENNEGTVKTQSITGISMSTNSTTGRTTVSTNSGIVFYVYNLNSAVYLDASSNGAAPENAIGWMEPQTAPTSGAWALGDLATSYLLNTAPSGDFSKDLQSGAVTTNSSGAFTYFAEDDGGQNWADWDEFMCGSECAGGSATFVPDTTYDPNGALGIFDVNFTQNSTTQTVSYCVAISVDKATNASAKGRLVCLDATSESPQLTIVQE